MLSLQFPLRAEPSATRFQGVARPPADTKPADPSRRRYLPPHILYCVSGGGALTENINYVRQLAATLDARWTALYVQAPFTAGASLRNSIAAEILRQAQEFGAQAVVLRGWSVDRAIARFVAENRVTHVVMEKGPNRQSRVLGRRSLLSRIIERLGGIALDITILDGRRPLPTAPALVAGDAADLPFPLPYLIGLGMVGAAVAVSILLSPLLPFLPVDSFGFIFLLPVLFTALFFGYLPSLAISVLSVIAFDFFIIPPVFSLTITSTKDLLALGSFFAASTIVSSLTAQSRRQREGLIERMHITEDLLQLSRRLGDAGSVTEIIEAGTRHLGGLLQAGAAFMLPEAGHLVLQAIEPDDLVPERAEFLRRVEAGLAEGAGAGGLDIPGLAGWMFFPLRAQSWSSGVVGLYREQRLRSHSPESRLLDGILGQLAVALERAVLRADILAIRDREETERLRNAVLTSISHDLRTPLSTVIGALSSLRDPETNLDPGSRDDLMGLALDEARRLNQFIHNLLDISRVESGRLTARMAPVDLGEAIGAAFERARPLLEGRPVEIAIPPQTPLVQADATFLEQVIFNLFDNAVKYTPVGTKILVTVLTGETRVTTEIIDEGAGIPEAALEAIFDKFTRFDDRGHDHPGGTGLGLAVCRGFVEVMGGRIHARNRTDRPGAILSFWLEAVLPDNAAYIGADGDEF